jgi:hypothetical protein
MTEAMGESIGGFVKGLYQVIGCLIFVILVLVVILGVVIWKVA